MLLRGTSSTAAAITAGTSAYQYNNIISIRYLTDNIHFRGSSNNCTDFHTLGQEALMVNLCYLSGSQADLVAVGAIASSSTQGNLLLRQLALQSLANRTARISSTGYTHGLIYIGTARQWITDSTAQTGSSTAERLDFSRMVMGLVLEHNQPFLIFAVNISVYHNAAGIDFLRLV